MKGGIRNSRGISIKLVLQFRVEERRAPARLGLSTCTVLAVRLGQAGAWRSPLQAHVRIRTGGVPCGMLVRLRIGGGRGDAGWPA